MSSTRLGNTYWQCAEKYLKAIVMHYHLLITVSFHIFLSYLHFQRDYVASYLRLQMQGNECAKQLLLAVRFVVSCLQLKTSLPQYQRLTAMNSGNFSEIKA